LKSSFNVTADVGCVGAGAEGAGAEAGIAVGVVGCDSLLHAVASTAHTPSAKPRNVRVMTAL
jgi:hypothetical protein